MAVARRALDLDSNFVIEKELKVSDIREGIEDTLEEVSGWLDEAQGRVYTGELESTVIVIKVTRG